MGAAGVTLESVAFYLLGCVSIGSALLVVTRRNPVMSVLCLILNFFCLAGLYLTLHAQFVAVIQIIVYAGAIMVLFLFVIMLLNLGDERRLTEGMNLKKVVAGGLTVALLAEVVTILLGVPPAGGISVEATSIGTVESIGAQLYTRFLFPFEITSLLLTAAIVGAILLAKKRPKA